MKPGVKFTKESEDEDMVVLQVEIADGNSLFTNRLYVGHQQLHDAVRRLETFKNHIHGGLVNLRFGEFGPEYAGGALELRLQFRRMAKVFVQAWGQSAFERFDEREFGSEAKLYLVTEPALLDEFILALSALSEAQANHAELGAIHWN